MTRSATHPVPAARLTELCRIARMARTVAGARGATLHVFAVSSWQDAASPDGTVLVGQSETGWADLFSGPEPVALPGAGGDDAPHRVAVPVRDGDGALLGALELILATANPLSDTIKATLENLCGLAAYVVRPVATPAGGDVVPAQGAANDAVTIETLVWQTDAQLRFTHVSSLAGVPLDRLIGQSLLDFGAMARDARAWEEHEARILSHEAYRDIPLTFVMPDGEVQTLSSAYPVFDEDGAFAGYRGLVREVKWSETGGGEAVAARFDHVTGLLSRVAWYRMLRLRMPGNRAWTGPATLLLVDIDNFKALNQRLGHSVADEVLRVVARRLEEEMGADDRLARIGSDEFAIVADGVSTPEDAEALAERIGEAFILPVEIGEYSIDISLTIGIALAPQDGRAADDLIASAALAQAHAKAQCCGRYSFYAPAMRSQMNRRAVLDEDLLKAVAGHEFELFYQPQIRLSDHRIIGAEALLRWRHPERGLLAPGAFIEVLEHSDYAISVGNWVIQEAVRQTRTWHEAGFPLRIGVNLSAAHFASFDVVDLVGETLCELGMDPGYLEMEVTENAVLQSGHDGRDLIAKLRRAKVRVAFDDFGTGYGSLSDLRAIPVDRIKIDRSFIQDATSSRKDAAIVRAIVSLAGDLGLATIAEGVENAAQEALLRQLGCDEVQGYLYSPPLPAAMFKDFLHEWPSRDALALESA